LFSLGGVLGQAARVYMTAVVLEVLLADELAWVEARTGLAPLVTAVGAIGLVAVVWTWMGGIATVVWTDLILFLLFLVGIAVALVVAVGDVQGGAGAVLDTAREAHKLRLLDLSTDPTKAYTFWAALIASSWGMVGSYGTDQLMAQRLFCCASARDARKAIVGSYAAMVVTALVGVVGLALYAYYAQHPLEGAARELVAAKSDRLFPVFVVQAVPTGLKGLVVAGAFAAAISSLDSILAALSQTTLSALYLPWRARRGVDLEAPEEQRRTVRVSRALVIVAAVLLCTVAVGIEVVARDYASILNLALAMAGYTGGALIAGFFLALLPLGIDGSGFRWSAPLSVLTVFAVTSHQSWAQALRPELLCAALALLGLALWLVRRVPRDLAAGVTRARLARQTAIWAVGLAVPLAIARWGAFHRVAPDGQEVEAVLAWPWYLPLGSLVAFVLGLALARPRAGNERRGRSAAKGAA
jgi:Na+/proline symporter